MVDQNEAYTFQKRGIYYFSRRVPSDLKDLYKVERLTYSLKTRCPKLAQTQVKEALHKLRGIGIKLGWIRNCHVANFLCLPQKLKAII